MRSTGADAHAARPRCRRPRAAFEIHNSPLSENAAVGFEFGYNIQEPQPARRCGKAQYGDFINGAQVVLDEFLTSGRAKWGLSPSLVLLLPHGYEGQGPDHSSARLERFLQSAADTNMRIANCTTAAQYFHVLRRQALLLEQRSAAARAADAEEPAAPPADGVGAARARRGPLPAGDRRRGGAAAGEQGPAAGAVQRQGLRRSRLERAAQGRRERGLVRVEQVYPFPADEMRDVLDGYPKLREVCWVQEEPENMGAWEFVRPLLEQLIDGRWPLRYIGRVRNSSPSEGSAAWHALNQRAIVEQAFEEKAAPVDADRVLSKQV